MAMAVLGPPGQARLLYNRAIMNRTWADIEPFLRQIEERYRKERLRSGPAADDLPDDLEQKVLSELRDMCDVYAHGDDEGRESIRAFLTWSYILPRRVEKIAGQYARAFDESGSEDLLRKAATAFVVAEGRPDIRDSFLAFKYLMDAAARKGIDAERVFMTIPGLSPSAPAEGTSVATEQDESFASRVWAFLRRSK